MKNIEQILKFLNGRIRRKLPKIRETYAVHMPTGDVCIVYRGTAVVTYKRSGDVVLRSGGYRTVTTKRRMNAFSSAHVYQRNGQWFVQVDGLQRLFEENFLLNPPVHAFKIAELPL